MDADGSPGAVGGGSVTYAIIALALLDAAIARLGYAIRDDA